MLSASFFLFLLFQVVVVLSVFIGSEWEDRDSKTGDLMARVAERAQESGGGNKISEPFWFPLCQRIRSESIFWYLVEPLLPAKRSKRRLPQGRRGVEVANTLGSSQNFLHLKLPFLFKWTDLSCKSVYFSNHLRHLRYLRHLGHLRHLKYLRHLRNLRHLTHLRYLRHIRHMRQFWQFDNLGNFENFDNPNDLRHLRHWLQFWQLNNWIHYNLCRLTIKSDTGQHSQFLRCFIWSFS